jgi:hypothetical protein
MTRPSPLPFALAAFTALLPARAQRGDVPADKARIIFVHTLDAARDRPLSAWTNRAGYAPLVERVAYGRWASADVDPGPQGYVPRLAGMTPPSAARLGWNAGAGNLLAGTTSFVVVTGVAEERASTQIHGAAATGEGRAVGVWPGGARLDLCVAGPTETVTAANVGGLGSATARQAAAGDTLVLHLANRESPCTGAPRGRFALGRVSGPEVLFVFGGAEGSPRVVACAERGTGCRALSAR